ncbi:dna repair protein rad14 [Lasallia pustulata]|uniref:DNA repair protein RAD14 n=1 Tax=Lasallia pustulata TaxID=136370 RepID=A0A1W5CYC0_9LECA|nr:dna repair protein rad14 [Lasallia pustulata]
MVAERPSTPPLQAGSSKPGVLPRSPLTPEQVKRIEVNRLKAKALRDQREAEARQQAAPTSLQRPSSNLVAGQKRTHSAISTSNVPANLRDGRSTDPAKKGSFRPLDDIQPARNFTKYVEYDFSKMTDTKGGFLTVEDDPHNKALHAPNAEEKPAHMTLKEWERHQLLRSLRDQKAGPFEPGLSVLKKEENKVCRECGSMEIDWKWEEIFGCAVCNVCKEKVPEKYSLLTKTEAKEDYLLTDPELKDEELLPHLERPNPHKATWNNMMLYLRYQVEEYAFTKKWGSAEALDEEFATRETEKKKRKEDKFKSKLQELKKKTRVEAYRRSRQAGGGGGEFGDDIGRGGKHTHVWGRSVENEDTGIGVKSCVECGMEVEELEF